MVINLCLPQFRPRIHCNKVSADGYEVENLISEDLIKRSHGFRTEYFIRPPIYVTVSFPFNVEICRINIDLTAGGCQNVTGLELYTSALSSRASLDSHGCWTTDPMELSVPDKEAFTLVGKVLLKNQNHVVFSHRGFKARPPFSPMEVTLFSPAVVAQELWNKGALSLSHVAHLKIGITHVTGSGISCIKRLEVWGQPAKTCSQEVINSVLLIASESLPKDLGVHTPALPMESDCDPGGQSEGQQGPCILQEMSEMVNDVPEEFLDPITLEIMPCPMLLPSGKVIDQSTLEKCNLSEATWGRVPSDPFTGLAFTPQSHPLPHPSLKARIDHFLLQHSVSGCHLLGRAQTTSAMAPSIITLPSRKRKPEQAGHSSDYNLGMSSTSSATSPLLSYSTSEPTAKKMKAPAELSLTDMDCSAGPVSHEQKLSQSLEIALTSTLGSMPSFTARLSKGQLQQLGTRGSSASRRPDTSHGHPRTVCGPECVSCKRAFSSYSTKEPVYQLPCGHLLCRPCLSEKQRSQPMMCTACQQPVTSQDVLRVHF
ncbi:RING finger protein 37 isoform X1 [Cricetulus griseus]|uniref:RING finger protein 37 n=1 Tax=Cricetulus griseus TaxID=10029 RepID=G3H440_CRIGR|nr:RING finger protein 37 isoform X1 [Cricetulus griseus]XP_007635235.1 RING finger protein 37 isoform X1 [Cricetulus griseus]XP_027277588.1 RING finger protein 37 isoform X1 [Cricetulus griseus]XP_027277589.1 RING finger protein 37 isoform X1 [Cricetulus griseus]XP_035302111.1 RING finger protein 37 isoform X1 [Cricetulus griseus]XP_035302112.1 RING finger protein 37 isoform X1 [Cricetulus griseus]XP_035306765.1 RING finger protein 37 isoform X1 [Cricetulus griseus]XP_035306767.1 RING finge